MNKFFLTALVPFALLAAFSSSALAERVTIISRLAPELTYAELYTETNWQRVQMSPETLTRMGSMTGVQLSVTGLPSNVKVEISTKTGPSGTVGLKITRTDKSYAVHQMGTFTLTNPANGESCTFQATVTGS